MEEQEGETLTGPQPTSESQNVLSSLLMEPPVPLRRRPVSQYENVAEFTKPVQRRPQSQYDKPVPPPRHSSLKRRDRQQIQTMTAQKKENPISVDSGYVQLEVGEKGGTASYSVKDTKQNPPPIPKKPSKDKLLHLQTRRQAPNASTITAPMCTPSRHEPIPGQVSIRQRTFVDKCKEVHLWLEDLNANLSFSLFKPNTLQSMKETLELLNNREIFISIFGQHNCGKSTLLNALMGEEYLPMYAMSETSMKVKIQHDSSKHAGYCDSEKCIYKQQKQFGKCPELQIRTCTSDQITSITGMVDIRRKLKALNLDIRDGKEVPPQSIVLRVHIPEGTGLDNAPPGWTVSLVDNPGFGEAKDHVTQLADASMQTSAGYIYLLQTEDIGGKEDAEIFKNLAARDEAVFRDEGRLIVGITKFDNNYQVSHNSIYGSDDSDSDSDKKTAKISNHATEESVKKKLQESIRDAVKMHIPEDRIIPLCGQWALWSGKLASVLRCPTENRSTKREKSRLGHVSHAVLQSPKIALLGGQGESQIATIKSMESLQLVQKLDLASGITQLRRRIKLMVENCVTIWTAKVSANYLDYLKQADGWLIERIEVETKHIQGKTMEFIEGKALFEEIQEKKKKIIDTTTQGEDTNVWKDIKAAYPKDIEGTNPQRAGKERTMTIVEEFRQTCKKKIDDKEVQFGPQEFKDDLQKWLIEAEKELERVFNEKCGFGHIHKVVRDHVKSSAMECGMLQAKARLFCYKQVTEEQSGDKKEVKEKPLKPPNLGEIKAKISIPEVELTVWLKIKNWFSSKFHVLKKTVTQDTKPQVYSKWHPDLDEAIDKVQHHMEAICETYFEEIEPHAVKYFYDEYCMDTEKMMGMFDAEFEEDMQKKETELTAKEGELTDLSMKNNFLIQAKKNVDERYRKTFVQHQRKHDSS